MQPFGRGCWLPGAPTPNLPEAEKMKPGESGLKLNSESSLLTLSLAPNRVEITGLTFHKSFTYTEQPQSAMKMVDDHV
jgi:hypothetical protein